MKIAVVLFNLGGPNAPSAVKPFLFNLFKDKNIIRLHALLRYPLAFLISRLRNKKAKNIYDSLGGKSPINQETEKQVLALEKILNDHDSKINFKTFYCMQYWHPMHPEVFQNVVDFNPDKVILLPLYPQYSTTTTKSSFGSWTQQSMKKMSHVETIAVCCYPKNNGFISAYGDRICDSLRTKENASEYIIIYSAHGIPLDCIEDGDPYQEHIEQTAKAITAYLSEKGFHNKTIVSYQSKVGYKKWLEPDTEEIIKRLSQEMAKIVVVPIAFTSEHSETLVELDIDYKEMSLDLGSKDFIRIPTVSTHPLFIQGLKNEVLSALSKNMYFQSKNCNDKFIECPKKKNFAPCIGE
jgi:ferrochelatase